MQQTHFVPYGRLRGFEPWALHKLVLCQFTTRKAVYAEVAELNWATDPCIMQHSTGPLDTIQSETAQGVELLSRERQWVVGATWSTQLLLRTWRCKESVHQHIFFIITKLALRRSHDFPPVPVWSPPSRLNVSHKFKLNWQRNRKTIKRKNTACVLWGINFVVYIAIFSHRCETFLTFENMYSDPTD